MNTSKKNDVTGTIDQNEEIFENSNGTVSNANHTKRSNLEVIADQIIRDNFKRSSSMNPEKQGKNSRRIRVDDQIM